MSEYYLVLLTWQPHWEWLKSDVREDGEVVKLERAEQVTLKGITANRREVAKSPLLSLFDT